MQPYHGEAMQDETDHRGKLVIHKRRHFAYEERLNECALTAEEVGWPGGGQVELGFLL